ESCLNPLDVILSLDRSGSMRSEKNNPPEPFTTVLSTAGNFIKTLTSDDQVGVVSFGNNANDESIISKNRDASSLIVSHMTLSTTTEQTNITEGLQNSLNQLTSGSVRSDSKKIVILLTDGIPTEPANKDIPDYPKISAQKVADEIKSRGIEIFTIGLGKDVSEGFLKSISTDDNHYFLAPSKETLAGVYSKIGSGLCPKKPNVITVMYRLP
ncbi:MAG TPA: vWA domain-containing protein, partial [Candidatus Paceibacterota bacterium]